MGPSLGGREDGGLLRGVTVSRYEMHVQYVLRVFYTNALHHLTLARFAFLVAT